VHLVHLHEVYRALLKARGVRGAVDFETTETQIVCDDNGRIEKIVPRVRTEAHRLIEEAMLAANVCAADFIEVGKHPALFRVHEGPTPEKRATLANYLRTMGVAASLSDDPKPSELQAIASSTRDRPDAAQIHTMLLRSMQQAIYTPVNSGHFGLAYEAYAHFTSPIRRYPDLLVHRVIKALLHGKRYHIDSGKLEDAPVVRKGGKPLPPRVQETEAWEGAGAHCSANERRADEASRDVQAWLKCRFMRDKLGEEFAGTVTAATSFGLFVQLDELFVEGLLHISELGGEYWRFDEVRQELRGERTGIRHGAGSTLRVQVSRVDLDARKIDFRLVGEGGDKLLARGRPGPSGTAVDEFAAVRVRDREVKAAARAHKLGRAGAVKGASVSRARSKAPPAKSKRR
jgi:ribonuclease R